MELVTILILIVPFIVPGVEFESIVIFVVVSGNILFVSLMSVAIYIKVKNDRLKKKILLWLEDAIETIAYSKKIGENRVGLPPKATKIRVRFAINGVTYKRESTAKIVGGQRGYLGTYNKYANREIRILYSPKYDEVLILKDNI